MCPKADTERTRQVCILWHFNAVAVDEENELQKVARLVCPPELMLPIVAVRDREVEQLDHWDNPVGHFFMCLCPLRNSLLLPFCLIIGDAQDRKVRALHL